MYDLTASQDDKDSPKRVSSNHSSPDLPVESPKPAPKSKHSPRDISHSQKSEQPPSKKAGGRSARYLEGNAGKASPDVDKRL